MASSLILQSATSNEDGNPAEALEPPSQPNLSDSGRVASTSDFSGQKICEINLSNLGLDSIPQNYLVDDLNYSPRWIEHLSLSRNHFLSIDEKLAKFQDLISLDLSSNNLSDLPAELTSLPRLKILAVKNNRLESDSLPKNFGSLLNHLEVLNLSGNFIRNFPVEIFDLKSLKFLHLGGNQLNNVPCMIGDISNLEILYLGGNRLTDIPATIGKLKNLTSLTLSDNRIETIPSAVALLRRLKRLSLHNNHLKTLPVELSKLRNLVELSLRGNPLVVRFVRDMVFDPPSLKELAGRTVKMGRVDYTWDALPFSLLKYLDSAHHCVNPKCKGVYFEARVEHVKFVDFCGKFRVPLLQYLCSPTCSVSPAFSGHGDSVAASSSDADASDTADGDEAVPPSKMKKILLG